MWKMWAPHQLRGQVLPNSFTKQTYILMLFTSFTFQERRAYFIGVLDIAGFEIFDVSVEY